MICVGVSETSGNTVVRSNTVGSFFPLGPRKFMPPIVMRVMVESMLALMMTIFLRSFLSSSPFLPPFSDCANTVPKQMTYAPIPRLEGFPIGFKSTQNPKHGPYIKVGRV